MSKKYSSAGYIAIFVIVQVVWLAVMGLWIARYAVSHVIYKQIGQRYAIRINSGADVAMLVVGLVLIAAGIAGISILFRRLNQQFHQTRLYDNFIASVTHELKTPLAAIRLYLDTIGRYSDISEEQRQEFLEQMRRETGRLERTIGAILEVGRIESGYARYQCAVLDAGPTLKSILMELAGQFRISMEQISISGDLQARIVFNPNALRSVFENLFENSRKYSPAAPRIDITLAETNDEIRINFRDYGVGVPRKQLKKIFRKFHRLADPQNPSVKGTGLGLYLVRGILHYHGGRIQAELPEVGEGLVMKIALPVYSPKRKRFFDKLIEGRR